MFSSVLGRLRCSASWPVWNRKTVMLPVRGRAHCRLRQRRVRGWFSGRRYFTLCSLLWSTRSRYSASWSVWTRKTVRRSSSSLDCRPSSSTTVAVTMHITSACRLVVGSGTAPRVLSRTRMLSCPLLCSTVALYRRAENCGAPQLQYSHLCLAPETCTPSCRY